MFRNAGDSPSTVVLCWLAKESHGSSHESVCRSIGYASHPWLSPVEFSGNAAHECQVARLKYETHHRLSRTLLRIGGAVRHLCLFICAPLDSIEPSNRRLACLVEPVRRRDVWNSLCAVCPRCNRESGSGPLAGSIAYHSGWPSRGADHLCHWSTPFDNRLYSQHFDTTPLM